MICEKETCENFGHSVSILSKGSNKKVCVICDYCKTLYTTTYKMYNKAREVVKKDSCVKCRYKKREDVSLAKYGVKNSAQRDDVRKKISDKAEGFDDKRRKIIKERYGVENPMNSQELKERQKQSVMDKYGVENVSQVKEVRDKVRKTNLEKYGNEEFLASEEGKQKKLEGIRTKYGVDNVFQSEEIKDKIRHTNLDRYGVDSPMKSCEIRQKSIDTVKNIYGVDNVSQAPEVKEKIKNTVFEKYGVDSVLQSPEIRKKIEGTNLQRYGVKAPTQNKEVYNKIIDTKIKNGLIKLYDGQNMHEIADELNKPYSTLVSQVQKYGIEKARLMSKKMTSIEFIIKEWLDANNIKYVFQFCVENRKADFCLTDHNIIIEVDGLFWHSDRCRPDDYHIKKRDLYIKHGYTPLFFREDEINNKLDIVKSIILNKMGQSHRIFARKCNIINMDRENSKKFFEQNHLMGKGRGVTYGLMYNNELVSAIIIRKKSGKHYEISRFCHKLGRQVVGGFSRLIKHFLRNHDVELLTTFIDRRYGAGDYLGALGFEFKNCSPSFCWTNTTECVHRLRFRGNSGYLKGFIKLWDCGQARYDLQT